MREWETMSYLSPTQWSYTFVPHQLCHIPSESLTYLPILSLILWAWVWGSGLDNSCYVCGINRPRDSICGWLLRSCACISSVWIARAVCLCRVPRYPRVLVHDNLCQSKALPFIVASISCWRVRLLDSFNLQSNWIVKLRNQLKLCSHQ